MGREAVQMDYIQNEKKRKSTLFKSKKTLKQKAYELATLCEVPLSVIIYNGPNSEPETYPENQDEVRAVIDRYMSIPVEKRYNPKRNLNLQDVLQDKSKIKDYAISGVNYPTWFSDLDGSSREELAELDSILEHKLNSVKEKIENLKGKVGNHNPSCDDHAQINGGFDDNLFIGPEVCCTDHVGYKLQSEEDRIGNSNCDKIGNHNSRFDDHAQINGGFNDNLFMGPDVCCSDQVGYKLKSEEERIGNSNFDDHAQINGGFNDNLLVDYKLQSAEESIGNLEGGFGNYDVNCGQISGNLFMQSMEEWNNCNVNCDHYSQINGGCDGDHQLG